MTVSYIVWIQNSSHVRLDNIILHDSMSWTLHTDCCRDVDIQNLVIDDNRHVANTDGIDITGCQNVRIEHCFISCADDGICLKNPQHTNRTLERVHVKDCVVLSVMNAFKIGTGTKHDIRDILVEDCIFCMPDIYPGSVSRISLESCDGTNLSHVTIRNITMDKIVCPLYIVLNMRNENREPYTEEVGKNSYWGGSIDQVCIENIHATDAELPSILTGFVAYKKDGSKVRQAIHNITISGFYVMYRDNEEILEIPDEFTEFLTDYPESNVHGDVDAYGIWARHVDDLVMKEICVKPRSSNTREMIRLYDCNTHE
ncbi:MAG: right-handed parallel beta-helix repeat-containing protein [Clostridiales bacterium]|nr:right-handed parallel beta-helix repeat-containing protein [Clostridiales bacterium]